MVFIEIGSRDCVATLHRSSELCVSCPMRSGLISSIVSETHVIATYEDSRTLTKARLGSIGSSILTTGVAPVIRIGT